MAHSHKKKKSRKEKTEQEAPTNCEMKAKSFRFCYPGTVVWLPVFLYALRIGFELTLWQDWVEASRLRDEKGKEGTLLCAVFCYIPTTCKYVHLDIPIKLSLLEIYYPTDLKL